MTKPRRARCTTCLWCGEPVRARGAKLCAEHSALYKRSTGLAAAAAHAGYNGAARMIVALTMHYAPTWRLGTVVYDWSGTTSVAVCTAPDCDWSCMRIGYTCAELARTHAYLKHNDRILGAGVRVVPRLTEQAIA